MNFIRFKLEQFRFSISSRCPSLQLLEKHAPLKIKKLKINECSVTINKTSYTIGIRNSLQTAEDLASGVDLDQFGGRALEQVLVQEPDEFLIRGIDYFDFQYKAEKMRIKEENEKITKMDDSEEKKRARGVLVRRFAMYQVNCLQSLAQKTKSREPISMVQIPFSQFLHFQTTDHLEVLYYHRKTHEALKYLLIKLLGGRGQIAVNKFHISAKGILRIPRLKLKMLNLKIGGNKIDEIFATLLENGIIDVSSFPLQSFHTDGCTYRRYPEMRSAKMIILECTYFGPRLLWSGADAHPRVHYTKMSENAYNGVTRLATDWILNAPPIGTIVSFGYSAWNFCNLQIKKIKKIEGAIVAK